MKKIKLKKDRLTGAYICQCTKGTCIHDHSGKYYCASDVEALLTKIADNCYDPKAVVALCEEVIVAEEALNG